MNNRLKRKLSNKPGCSCAMCKPHKHKWADRRTRQDRQADASLVAQLLEIEYYGN